MIEFKHTKSHIMNQAFYVQADCLEAIKTLPVEKRNAMLGAIAGYQIDESIPDFENEMMVIFLIAKVFIDQRKRRSLSHTRSKSPASKPTARPKSARESIKEIIENTSTGKAEEPEAKPESTQQPVRQKGGNVNPAQRPQKTQAYDKNHSTKEQELSPEVQLAIKKLTAICNKSRQNHK